MVSYLMPLGLFARGLQAHTWGRLEEPGDQFPRSNMTTQGGEQVVKYP